MDKIKFGELREKLSGYPIFGEFIIEIEKVRNSCRIGLYDFGVDDVVMWIGIDPKCLVMEFIADADGAINMFGNNCGDISKPNKSFVAELVGSE